MTGAGLREAFCPETNPSLFRRALGHFTTGVTVITTRDQDGPVGMTANSFSSVSLSPPLVLWSPAKSSQRHGAFVGCETFLIHVLSATQNETCNHFARSGRDFSTIAHTLTASGIPVLEGCAAVFHCRRHGTHDAGDHTLVIGEVMQAAIGEGSALVFSHGSFHSLDFRNHMRLPSES